jgi:Ser/Thr protein kinase RdoA (MazF antagonist)
MSQLYIPEKDTILTEVLAAFDFPATLLGAVRYGQGHINDTFCVLCQPQEGDAIRFILQGLSLAAFPRQDELMENFVGITSYLRDKIIAQGGDPLRETLSLVKTRDGKDYYTDGSGKVWRLTPFIENTDCFQSATPELFEASARAFGRFQYMLQGYPAETLHEAIVNFHNTEDRYAKFIAALEADKLGRAKDVQAEIEFVTSRKADCSVALQALRDGILPLRVTHNDTKLNNILIDRDTQVGICVIDLDTTMPGLSINDFGDSIRFGANHSKEDEKDLSKVNFDIELYEAYTRGFIQGAQGGLTENELKYLPWGARLMTLECGIRFLTDYLDGDNYFRIHYPEQNLDRCRTQFKLVKDMEEQFDAMAAVIEKYAR